LKIDGFAKGSDGGFGIGFEEEGAEVEVGFEEFWVESDGAFVFGAGLGGAMEIGVGVG